MRKAQLHLNKDGFTLLEVLAAMVVMTVGLLGLLQAVNIAMQYNLKNKLRDVAVMIGEQQMNGLMKLSFDAPIQNAVTTIPVNSGGLSKSYRVERTKIPLTNRTPENSYHVRVNIRWSFRNVSTNHEVMRVVSRP